MLVFPVWYVDVRYRGMGRIQILPRLLFQIHQHMILPIQETE